MGNIPGYRTHFSRGRGITLPLFQLLVWKTRPGETLHQSMQSTIHDSVSAYLWTLAAATRVTLPWLDRWLALVKPATLRVRLTSR
jgi:hypothetical protein